MAMEQNKEKILVCNGDMRYQFGTDESRKQYTLMVYTNSILGLLTFVMNLSVFVSIFSTKLKKTPSFRLLVILTIINLSQGILLQPLSATNSLFMSLDKPVCLLIMLNSYISLVMAMMDIMTICMINIQFFLAVSKPFFYESHCNKIGYWIVLILSIVVFTGATVISYYYQKFRGIFIISVGISTLSIYVIICILFFFVSREVNAILNKAETTTEALALKSSLKRTRKLASSALIAYTVSVLPVAVSSLFLDVTSPTAFWLAILMKCNGIFDPIIYCIRMKSIRKPIFSCLKKCLKC